MNFVMYSKQIEINIDYGNAIVLNTFSNKIFFLFLVNVFDFNIDFDF